MNKRVLITGIAGFAGAHFLEHFLINTDWDIVGIDSFAHKGISERITDSDVYQQNKHRVQIFTHDLTAPLSVQLVDKIGPVNYIIQNASESHVDRSIKEPVPFVENNVKLILNVLEYARKVKPEVVSVISCYDEQTRAVTKDGLKYYHELTTHDEVLTLGADRKPVFQKVDKIIVQDYVGEMVKFGGRADLLVTPNHRMYDDEMAVSEAGEVKHRFNFPVSSGTGNPDASGFFVDGLGILDAENLLYVLGVFIGDGFTAYQEKVTPNKSGLSKQEFIDRKDSLGRFVGGRTGSRLTVTSKSHRIFFDVPEKDKARARLERSLSALGLKWSAQKGKSGEHVYLTSEALSAWFDKNVGKLARGKRIPSFVWGLGGGNLQALYDGLIDSDGHYGKTTHSYTTVGDKLASDVALLSFLLGKRVSLGYKYSKNNYQGRTIEGGAHQVTITGGKLTTKKVTAEPYHGKVWCITVKNKNFLVERNGKFAFSGNTDEVFGAAPEGVNHKEWDPIKPSNPYSASKAAQEAIAISYWRTYGVPVIITNTMNLIGERQDPEKFVPMVIKRVLDGETVKIHGTPDNIGSRYYLHCRNQADAQLFILNNLPPKLYPYADRPDRYNIVGEREVNNLEMAQMIAEYAGKELKYEFEDFHATRSGHDRRYALDGTKLKELGWVPPVSLEDSLKRTVEWTIENQRWLLT